MIARTLPGICVRPALAVTLAIVAAAIGAILLAEHALRGAGVPNGAQVFAMAYNVLVCALLVSLGRFTDKLTSELGAVRLAQTVPGLRRKMTVSVALLVPVAALLGMGFLAWAVPAQVDSGSFVGQAGLNALLFCAGLGLGRSWLLPVGLALLVGRHAFIVEQLRGSPMAFAAVALAGSGVLGWIWRARFLPPAGGKSAGLARLLGLDAAAKDALARRTGDRLRDTADWDETASRLTVRKLIKAGVHERLGHRWGALPGTIACSIGGVYGILAVLLVTLAARSPAHNLVDFCQGVFTAGKPDQWMVIARVAFAAITGMVAYVSAVMLDTSLRPNLWHPVSRRLQARAVFWSRVWQNGCFALAHLAVAGLLVAGFAGRAGKWPDLAVWGSFFLPVLAGFLLAPIPQALFPHGPDTFHAKANSLVQLGAGLLGGGFCLLTVHWARHWPTTELHAKLPGSALAAGFAAAVLAVYGASWAWTRFRYARVDLSRRAL